MRKTPCSGRLFQCTKVHEILGYTPSYSGFFTLSDVHFKAVLSAGKVNENFIVD